MKYKVYLTPIFSLFTAFLIFANAQSPSYQSFVNPVIPGDHPDPTLTKVEDYFYTSGSSFNPTPKIYRSTDLVHWEVIAQPVKASWVGYGNNPGAGVWGGHTVYMHGKYWHYFGRNGNSGAGMYFVTANSPTGAWSDPVAMNTSNQLPPFGVDNSIFIDEDNDKWYLLTKAGHENNHMIELGENGQPTGEFLDLTWLNPNAEDNPYGWAEGPVMWKYEGMYYYSFAEHLVGQQYVMRSDTLTDNKSDWEIMSGSMFRGSGSTFNRPNHISPAVTISDETSWVIGHSYHQSSNWQAQGRQGLLMKVSYENGWPIMQYPSSGATTAPDLPNNRDIPWMVPKSDMFKTARMIPEWSVLGYTPEDNISLSERAGWLRLEPSQGNTSVIQNDGEHQYSIITRVDFEPSSNTHRAGLWIVNGPETHYVKVYSSLNGSGDNVLGFSFTDTKYEVENTIGNIVWLKLIREDHTAKGYYSEDGVSWTQIGNEIDIQALDQHQNDFNDFTGNQQGLFVEGKEAFFDLYIYRDAYSDISAKNPANFNGVTPSASYLNYINNDDWALYAGVQFGTRPPTSGTGIDYQRSAKQINVTASSDGVGGTIEVWLEAIDTGSKIAEVEITDTGGLNTYEEFSAVLSDEIIGSEDVYLRFKGSEEGGTLFRLQKFSFSDMITTSVEDISFEGPNTIELKQNYPNPFNPSTMINFQLAADSKISLKVFDILGREVATLVNGKKSAGLHRVTFDASGLSSGIYFYILQDGTNTRSRKMILIE